MTLQQLNLSYSMLACHWLNTRTLALLDAAEVFHLVDVRTREELDTLDLAGVGLVYNTSFFKGLATGGNVSKALVSQAECVRVMRIVSCFFKSDFPFVTKLGGDRQYPG